MRHQTIICRSNIGRITVNFGWQDNIARYSEVLIDGVDITDTEYACLEEPIALTLGEGMPPQPGDRYQWHEYRDSLDAWAFWSNPSSEFMSIHTKTGRWIIFTVESNRNECDADCCTC